MLIGCSSARSRVHAARAARRQWRQSAVRRWCRPWFARGRTVTPQIGLLVVHRAIALRPADGPGWVLAWRQCTGTFAQDILARRAQGRGVVGIRGWHSPPCIGSAIASSNHMLSGHGHGQVSLICGWSLQAFDVATLLLRYSPPLHLVVAEGSAPPTCVGRTIHSFHESPANFCPDTCDWM